MCVRHFDEVETCLVISPQFESRVCSLHCLINIRFWALLNLSYGFFGCWINSFESFTRLGLVPLIIDENLFKWNRKSRGFDCVYFWKIQGHHDLHRMNELCGIWRKWKWNCFDFGWIMKTTKISSLTPVYKISGLGLAAGIERNLLLMVNTEFNDRRNIFSIFSLFTWTRCQRLISGFN